MVSELRTDSRLRVARGVERSAHIFNDGLGRRNLAGIALWTEGDELLAHGQFDQPVRSCPQLIREHRVLAQRVQVLHVAAPVSWVGLMPQESVECHASSTTSMGHSWTLLLAEKCAARSSQLVVSGGKPLGRSQSVEPVVRVFFGHAAIACDKDKIVLPPDGARALMKPDKQTVMLELLKEAWVYVHIDPRREGVVLPEFLREEPRVVLQYGYNMPVPIYDLIVDERGIGATLSFRRVAQPTFIPWSAVFALTDGEKHGMVWEEDIPHELLKEAAAPAKPTAEPAAPTLAPAPAPNKPASISALPSVAAAPGKAGPSQSQGPSQGQSQSPGQPAGKRPRPSHLKLVD